VYFGLIIEWRLTALRSAHPSTTSRRLTDRSTGPGLPVDQTCGPGCFAEMDHRPQASSGHKLQAASLTKERIKDIEGL